VRILHIFAPGPVGGLERVVRTLAVGCAAEGHHVSVGATVVPGSPPLDWLAGIVARGVAVHRMEYSSHDYLREWRAIVHLAHDVGAEVVHTHGYRSDVLASVARRALAVPIVTTVHGLTSDTARSRVYEAIQRIAWRRFDAVVAVSEALSTHITSVGVEPWRVRVIPNAWQGETAWLAPHAARRRLNVPDGIFHLGWVGRLSHEKGLDVLLRALCFLQDIPLRLSVLGDGPQRQQLQRLACSLGVDRAVTWHGVVPDASALVRAYDVQVLSSRREGTPMVVLDAMAAGVPVVATAVGGVPAMLAGGAGLLVPPLRPDTLASAIRDAATNPHAWRTRIDRARTRIAQQFAAGPWLGAYLAVYEQVAQAAGEATAA
jgi:glycosyltransferase involved in cell wall biosynthesis